MLVLVCFLRQIRCFAKTICIFLQNERSLIAANEALRFYFPLFLRFRLTFW